MTRPSPPRPALETLKDQAERLRAALEREAKPVSHSRALERVAAQHGVRDWNTLRASLGNRPPFDPYRLGARVRGHYLGQPFEAVVPGVQVSGSEAGRFRLTLRFDEPVDVVSFASFSAFRRRVSCTMNETGRTKERTSDDRPHLELHG